MTTAIAGAVDDWDFSQKRVITASACARIIVDAGPGTGKTAVACARLAHLVSECGVEPSKTWMISFTRTAVAEIRARLHAYLGDDATAVRIATVDSHAWTIHSGFDENATLTSSYEANIEKVLDLVRGHEDVSDYLERVEHLILDEAQDFVGVRADLVEAIMACLSPNCGITVFADEAQSIYGFSEEDSFHEDSATELLGRLRSNSKLCFVREVLDRVHRTDSEGLLSIFSDVRKTVLSKKASGEAGGFESVREAIGKLADSNDLKATSLQTNDLGDGALVLFRTRAEALQASQFCTIPHSLRLSGMGASLPPWIAVCFGNFCKSHMGKQEFTERWLAKVESICPPQFGSTEAWERLVRLGGSGDGSLDMRRLRSRLGRQSPPVELANMEFGLPGPIIGTIHASKGREADRVLLLVPKAPEFENAEQENEETRVLFVGSTRARQKLEIGDALKSGASSVGNRRAYRVQGYKKAEAMVEIGKPEDISVSGLVGTAAGTLQECADAQEWLATHSCALVSLKVQADPERDWSYKIIVPKSEQFVAVLSDSFKRDMWQIANKMTDGAGKKINTPYSVNHVRAFGSRSIVLRTDDPILETLNSPWKESGFVLAPRIAAFTKVYFRRADG